MMTRLNSWITNTDNLFMALTAEDYVFGYVYDNMMYVLSILGWQIYFSFKLAI